MVKICAYSLKRNILLFYNLIVRRKFLIAKLVFWQNKLILLKFHLIVFYMVFTAEYFIIGKLWVLRG